MIKLLFLGTIKYHHAEEDSENHCSDNIEYQDIHKHRKYFSLMLHHIDKADRADYSHKNINDNEILQHNLTDIMILIWQHRLKRRRLRIRIQ